MVSIFNGKYHASLLDTRLRDRVKTFKFPKNHEKTPLGLGIVSIGDDPASRVYVRYKQKLCKSLGIPVFIHSLAPHNTDTFYRKNISNFIQTNPISGVIVQLPFHATNTQFVLDSIPTHADIDILTSTNRKQFYSDPHTFKSPIVKSFEYFLGEYDLDLTNMTVDVIGSSTLVGLPLLAYVINAGASVNLYSLDDSFISSLKSFTDSARLKFYLSHISFKGPYIKGHPLSGDMVILTAGVANMLDGKCVPSNSIVVDFGTSLLNNHVVGDFNLNSDTEHLKILSPSPGGMGPLVVRFLIDNLLDFYAYLVFPIC